MTHVVLLGDSVFDNAAYVPGGPDVIRQVREHLSAGWQATVRAVDGATTAGVPGQVQRLPPEATHLVVSVGGNDALGHVGVLEDTAPSIAHALNRLADIGDRFAHNYRAMLDGVVARRLPTALCTIYEPRFPDPRLQRLAVTALNLFNDPIVREAARRGLPLLDLRLICNNDRDFANPIEPSVQGGAKIAAVIARVVTGHDFNARRCMIYAQ
jgi:hypothetical protein